MDQPRLTTFLRAVRLWSCALLTLLPAIAPRTALGGSDGANPEAGLTLSGRSLFYGTTYNGGPSNFGTVFQVSASGTPAVWTEKVIYSFLGGADGANPQAPLVQGSTHVLYGTTYQGGTSHLGTVFSLTPGAGGVWTEKVLYTFTGKDGANPMGGLVIAPNQVLYGATSQGGDSGEGAVFQLVPAGDGTWTESLLYSFTGGSDGGTPSAGLVQASTQVLFGTTARGGASDLGTVFSLTPAGGGVWTEHVLHTFTGGDDGATPLAGLVLASNLALYGTTIRGGTAGLGTVFQLIPATGGVWTENIIHSFGGGTDGANPQAGLILDSTQTFYGTTSAGGANNLGTVFQLAPATGGGWTGSVIYSFTGTIGGARPQANVIMGAGGGLFGTAKSGGSPGLGVVFKLAPPPSPGPWKQTVLYAFTG